MASNQGRLARIEQQASASSRLAAAAGGALLTRLAQIAQEQGGPEELRAWLIARCEEVPPVSDVDRGRLIAKVVAMANVWTAPTPGDKKTAWAALRAIGRQ